MNLRGVGTKIFTFVGSDEFIGDSQAFGRTHLSNHVHLWATVPVPSAVVLLSLSTVAPA